MICARNDNRMAYIPLIMHGEGGTARSIARAGGGRKTGGGVDDEWVLAGHGRVIVGCCEEMLVGEHAD